MLKISLAIKIMLCGIMWYLIDLCQSAGILVEIRHSPLDLSTLRTLFHISLQSLYSTHTGSYVAIWKIITIDLPKILQALSKFQFLYAL